MTSKSKTPAKPPPTRLRRLLRLLVQLGLLTTAVAMIGALGLLYAYNKYVVEEPGPQLDETYIRGVIAQESPVYYRDGTTRIGVFFADEHRTYVPFAELPKTYVTAIVAAEDGTFWTHHGVEPKHIARAIWQNLTSGDLVAGGSTLTQQTAKNIYYRPDRSLKSKGTELVNALRLEAHYTKPDILEFYANQFHVSGNGRGLGIAARYFFDKDVSELTLAESAFLAGLVKGPSNYDPFLGDKDRQARARQRAHDRTSYVLRRIVDEPIENLTGPAVASPFPNGGSPTAEDVTAYKQAAQALLDGGFELEFRRGKFRFDSNAVLDEVARRLAEPPFDEVLAKAGIEDPSRAGLVVVTTLDEQAQNESVYALWHHLTEVGTMLEATEPAAYTASASQGPHWDPARPILLHEFRVAEVDLLLGDAGKKYLMLDLGGTPCVADREAMVRVASAIQRGRKQDKNAKVSAAFVDEIVGTFPKGALVTASVRSTDDGAGRAVCDLEVRPELQGALVIVEDGQIRAMVGGNDNRNFNRAGALRQLGSTWKPLVYHSALQLGWGPTDALDNRRNGFPFSTTFYWPSPDHAPGDTVSMAWAGTNSENLASIWLMYHLTDRLGDRETAELAAKFGLAKRADETDDAYRLRIQQAGVLPTPRRVDEALFLQSRHEVATNLVDQGHPEDRLALETMLYGWGFESERAKVGGDAARQASLDRSWLVLGRRADVCASQYAALASALPKNALPLPEDIADLRVKRDGERVHVACGAAPADFAPPDETLRLTATAPVETERPRFIDRWFGTAEEPVAAVIGPTLDAEGDVLVDGALHLGTLRQLQTGIERRRAAREALGDEAPGLYDPDLLYWHQDFRVLLGMKFVAELARQYGVRTEIHEVIAMPLGASEITIEEATTLYEGLATGATWDFPGTTGGLIGGAVAAPATSTLLVAEIRDVDGNVLYRAEPVKRVVTSPASGAMTADILRNVVKYGTGKRALDAIQVRGADGVEFALPIGGKTGTTNDYKNAAFIGYAPKASADGFHVEDALFVGVYVGYDDNRSMDVGNIRLAGANGALPAWIDATRGLARAGLLGPAPSTRPSEPWWPLVSSPGLAVTTVDAKTGLPLDAAATQDTDGTAGAGPTVLIDGTPQSEPQVDLGFEPVTRPVRIAPHTEDASSLPAVPLWGAGEDLPE